jgi:hypothetical protein
MAYGGIDVPKKQRWMCLLSEAGALLPHRIPTQREQYVAVCAERPTARIVLAASTKNAWVARCVEALGHAFIVTDPNDVPMDAQRS